MSAEDEGRLGCTDCERLRPGRIAQPVNTVTSLAFLAAGGWLAFRSMGSARRRDPQAVAFAAVLGLVGAGSVAFHGPQPRGAKALHDVPIAAALAMAVVTPALRLAGGRRVAPGWTRPRGAVLAATVASASAAYAAGRTGSPLCRPDSPLQWHGVWHVLAAGALGLTGTMLYTGRSGPGDA